MLGHVDEELTIAAVVARSGLPESTLRYWERIGLTPPVARDPSSGHRRYREEDVVRLETLANLRGRAVAGGHARLPGRSSQGRRGGGRAAGAVRGTRAPPGARGGRAGAPPHLSRAEGPLLGRSRGRRPRQGRRDRRRPAPGHPATEPEGTHDMTSSISSPFGAASTALEVVEGVDLHGRRALVTGAASGIGVETARALAAAGAETIMAARDTTAAERVAADVRATTGNPAVSVAHLDLLDRGSI